MTATATRADRRTEHEHHCCQALNALTIAIPDDLPSLNNALGALNALHHGSRSVRRTTQPTNREQHRRTIDTLIDQMTARADTLTLETTDPDTAPILHYVHRTIDKIGYR